MRALAIAVVAVLATACIGDLDPPSFVDRTRIVAARVSPDRDPSIAEPSAGDAITIAWWTITPGAPEPIAASLVACAPLGGSGNPGCAPGSAVPVELRAASTDPFVTHARVPDTIGATWLIFGVVCAGGGTPSMNGDTARCEGGPEERRADLVALEIPIAPDGSTPNLHPTLDDEPWTIDGMAWDPADPEPALEGCAASSGSPSLPAIAVTLGRPIPITIGWSDDDRETFDDGSLEGGREALQISHFTTAGDLARGTSAADDLLASGTPISIDWTLPSAEEVPEGGLLVRMTAIARDGRGGVARADRALCVTP